MKKPRRLIQEYLFWLGLLLLLFIASWQLISNFYHQQVIQQQETYLERKGQFIIQLTKDHVEDLPQTWALADDLPERLTLLDAHGKILLDTYDDMRVTERSSRPEIKAILSGRSKGTALRQSPTLNEELLYVALPIQKDGKLLYILRLAEPTKDFVAKADNVKRSMFIVYALLWLIMTAFMWRLLYKKNYPLATVLPVLKRMTQTPANQEHLLATTPETNELYETINLLSAQMQQTYLAYTASEKQLALLLNELTIGIFTIDQQGYLQSLNPTMQQQLGCDTIRLNEPFAQTITDTQLIQMIYQVDHTHIVRTELQTAQTNKILDVTIRYFPESRQTVGIAYDLTQIRRLEKMQRDFVGNVSHELKTPVTSLIGFTETLLDGAKEDPETLTTFLEIMQKDARRLEQLIQEIIHLSKTSDAYAYSDQEIDVSQLCTQIIASYQQNSQAKQLTIVLNCDEHFVVITKIELFYSIIKNLLENAINYSLPEQTITITCSQTTQGLQFSVADQGLGIAQADQARIFERFYRVDKARARHSGGTGLGLAIVKEYVDVLGGTIILDSHLGIGSTFTVTLPNKKA